MKQLINAPETVVREAIEGLIRTNAHLQRLDGFPDIKVVFDKNHDKSKVAVISGGGSGHEPAHAGYVGRGMLAAAVCGEVFASPSAEAVLAAIRTVTGPAGCLLVVKNYTGDRLHFGLAAEQAKAEGLSVEMVVVGEDVAIEQPGLAGRRGLAGTVLVHKAAGAAAAQGASLAEVVAVAKCVAENSATLGVALKVCTLPGKEPSDRLGPGEIEIGLGIHGEPGHTKAPAMPADELVGRMLSQIAASHFFGPVNKGDQVVLLVNNLGATPPLEMSLVTQAALSKLEGDLGLSVARCYVGPLMTSLDMAGVSLTLLKLPAPGTGQDLLQLLDWGPVGAPGWPAVPAHLNPDASRPAPVPGGGGAPAAPARPATLSPSGQVLEGAIRAAASAVLRAGAMLDQLDAKVGDGDCGSTLAHGARAILSDLDTKYPLNDAAATVWQLAKSVRHAIGGSSGALYDVFATAAARSLKEAGAVEATPQAWALALRAGTEAVMKYGGAWRGCRTMLDALLPAADAAVASAVERGEGAAAVAAAAAAAAQAGAEETKSMAAAAGRASYVPEEVLQANPDPGAVAVATWLKAVADSLSDVA
eukprot:CAMPEP_0202906546 /NCGR_PEP_ID=MMETSP1392-20130828/39357_1 /ASSEMBLY_ACC=CAM_ASM_000868 /TAXON_ID=225041 /ORGANISM="Chlamydomonas chlamydogama, Strain SAG 11-48b" /LENGTH=587 /DNA_ID=CAMNT_0049595115 /DNA_START=17 /DNA_END=1780 /DNA_ORIENTATION=+